jgi:hypothetical protein
MELSLQEGVRIIPLISSKQLTQSSLQDSVTSNNYIPLRFNQAGYANHFNHCNFSGSKLCQ